MLLLLLTTIIWLELLPEEESYGVVLARYVEAVAWHISWPPSVALVSLGSTIQQSSFYGLTSMLPTRYTQVLTPPHPHLTLQAVMVGESAAGLLACLARLATKALLSSPSTATSLFFLSSILTMVACMVCFLKVVDLDPLTLS